ncbi:hypothetical protein J3R30DRAFT_3402666 [Lentinula aciculospora]|uniref:Uncharacterized protein n=1 Tax=Lentinula aciculospora TaxID=153920 RepID=A0A9W9AHL1_9AGAR|nr:hypothetical protein J3R30DRAFT_3402666 [Lentinula aciculospora]
MSETKLGYNLTKLCTYWRILRIGESSHRSLRIVHAEYGSKGKLFRYLRDMRLSIGVAILRRVAENGARNGRKFYMVVMDFDTAWCPVCDRQISPKRTTQLVTTDPRPAIGHSSAQVVIQSARQRNAQNRPVTKTKTVIDQGPYPLYCSDECKMADMLHQHEDVYAPPTYPIYHSSNSHHNKSENTEGSPPSDIESDCLSSTTTDVSYPSPTSENSALPTSTPITCQPKQRSRSFLTGSSSNSVPRYIPSSLPTTSAFSSAFRDYEGKSTPPTQDDFLLSQFQGSFTRRSESRVSMYSSLSSSTSRSPPSLSALSTSPRRERPLLPHAAQGKLLVPEVYVRVPTRPSASRRESSSSLASMASISSAPGVFTTRNRTGSVASIGSSRASLKSPLARYGSEFGDDEKDHCDLSEEDEYACDEEDAPLSPRLGGFGFGPSLKRPLMSDMRAWSFDAYLKPSPGSAFSTIRESRKERRKSEKKDDMQRYNPDGKKLFLFPTD